MYIGDTVAFYFDNISAEDVKLFLLNFRKELEADVQITSIFLRL